MRVYRIEFDNQRVYDFAIESVRLFVGAKPLVRLLVYRVVNGERDSSPLRRVDGERLEFTAANEEAACTLACEVLEAIHDTRLRRVSHQSGETSLGLQAEKI